MMRLLAEFIMRGRLQASLVALLGNLVPMISPATVGLVTLRKSYQDGLLVLVWAAIPLLATFYLDSANFLIVLTSLTTLIAVLVAAEVLKATVSWSVTLVVILGLCSLATIATGGLMQAETAHVAKEVQAVMGNLDALQENQTSPFFALMAVTAVNLSVEKITAVFVLGFLSWLTVMHVIGSLLLSRWWQALLFNPGGFREEFHGLRFTPVIASLLIFGLVVLQFLSPVYMPWASMMGFPLLLAGIGLTHHAASAFGLNALWLIACYAGLILVSPLSLVLIGVSFLDSFLDFRSRIANIRKS